MTSGVSGKILIQAIGVERVYRAGASVVAALQGIDLEVLSGEYISLMGPSGSGKTTFFNLLGALDVPTAGRILLGGRDLRSLTPGEMAYLRCANIGYIFQNYNVIEVISALQNVMVPMRFLGMGEKQAARKAAEVLTRVGLGHRMHHLPRELSGGQQQRVAIARALANDPALILADEPTGNLDSKTAQEIVHLLSELSRERGVTVISATHDHRMLSVSDRVVYLRDGRVERILRREQLRIEVGSVEGN